jgi:hypothetical protein
METCRPDRWLPRQVGKARPAGQNAAYRLAGGTELINLQQRKNQAFNRNTWQLNDAARYFRIVPCVDYFLIRTAIFSASWLNWFATSPSGCTNIRGLALTAA